MKYCEHNVNSHSTPRDQTPGWLRRIYATVMQETWCCERCIQNALRSATCICDGQVFGFWLVSDCCHKRENFMQQLLKIGKLKSRDHPQLKIMLCDEKESSGFSCSLECESLWDVNAIISSVWDTTMVTRLLNEDDLFYNYIVGFEFFFWHRC